MKVDASTQSSCPTQDQLISWSAGELRPSEAELFESHIAACESCQQNLDQQDARDPIVGRLRSLGLRATWTDDETELATDLEGLRCSWSQVAQTQIKNMELEKVIADILGPPTQPNSIGQLGRYAVLGILGSGGMGIVLEAKDSELDRRVAIKLLKPKELDENERSRFLLEARANAKIRHPHVCAIHDVGQQHGAAYVVMDLIQGESLEQRLVSSVFDDPINAVAIVIEVAEALEAVHSAGIVHRDVKPGNIMINNNGEAILTDFGLAQDDGGDRNRLTQEGTLLGTPAYIAAEQAAGEFDQIGPWTDVYSLAVVLYRMLTGREPFEGPLLTVLSKVAQGNPPAPSAFRADIDPALETVILKAMAADHRDRYRSAREFKEAAQSWLDSARRSSGADDTDFVVSAESPTLAFDGPDSLARRETAILPEQRPAKPRARRWYVGIAAVAAFLLVVAGAVMAPQIRKIIVRDKEGNKKAEILVDKDDTLELQENGKTILSIPGKWGNRANTTKIQKINAAPKLPIAARPAIALDSRVTKNLEVLYLFQEGKGTVIHDASNVGEPLDLQITEESRIHWIPGGGIALERPTVAASANPATKVIEACRASNELTIEVWVRAKVRDHTGLSPARIVSLSKDPLEQNFVFGQTGINFEARLRATTTDLLGKPETKTPWDSQDGRFTHGVLTRDEAGDVRIYVDGRRTKEYAVKGDFSNWATDHRFCLGNEPTEDRPWLGEFYLVAVYSRALTEPEVLQNYTAATGAIAITCLSKPNAVADENFEVTWTDKDAGDGIITWYCSSDPEGDNRQRIVTLLHDDFEEGATDRWQPMKDSAWKVVRDPHDRDNLVLQGETNMCYLGSTQVDFSDVVVSARILGTKTNTIPGVAVHYDATDESLSSYRLRFCPSTFNKKNVEPGLYLWKQPGNLPMARTEYMAKPDWATYEISTRKHVDGTLELEGWALSPDNRLLARLSTTDDAAGTVRPNKNAGGIALYDREFFDDVYVDPIRARFVRDGDNRFAWDTSRLPDGPYYLVAKICDGAGITTVVSAYPVEVKHDLVRPRIAETDRRYTWPTREK